MLNFNKLVAIIISLQLIIISTFIPVFITVPFSKQFIQAYEIPISWQLPTIILITLFFKSEIAIKAFTLYILIGLFYLPVFHNGGSLGYLLSSNFGYLLGIYPLIKVIDKLKVKNHKIHLYDILRYGILGICIMHITGIIYSCFLILYFKNSDFLIYNVSKYSLGKFGYHLLMLTPVTLFINIINKQYKYEK